jgi:autotransporter-associated beta strand protein
MTRFVAIAVAIFTLIAGFSLCFRQSHPLAHSNGARLSPKANVLRGEPPKPKVRSSANVSTRFTAANKRTWDTNFFAALKNAASGDPIRFKLVAGKIASGKISRVDRGEAEPVFISGEFDKPEAGRFFFQKQTLPGIAGASVGVVEFPSLEIAYRLEPTGLGGASELVERPLAMVKCVGLPHPASSTKVELIPPLNPAEFPTLPMPSYQNGIEILESLAGAKGVVYLDFQGGYTPSWGGIAYERPALSVADIREIWQRVAEDYMPFNINVTTDLKTFEKAPQNSRAHVIVTPTTTAQPGAGGASYVGSFNWTGETPCWVFELSTPRYCAQACAHEAGHTLGLVHDGQEIKGTHYEYYYGHNAGNSNTSWAPIMGIAYYDNVTQWSKGEYQYANNSEDQLLIIANQNNVDFRPDDTGDTLATSRYLETYSDSTAGAQGVIEHTGDTDAFQFTTRGGLISLRADPVSLGPDLAIQASLFDASDNLLAVDNPQDTLWASIQTNLPAGTYTFRVTGAGRNDPLTNGFSDYASLGYYSITGSVASARLPNRFAIPEYATNGTLVGMVSSFANAGDQLLYSIVSGNTSNTFAVNNAGMLTVADSTMLDYETLALNTQLAVQFELLLNITDVTHPALNATNHRVLVAVTNINEPPVITGFVYTNTSNFFLGPAGMLGWYGFVSGAMGAGTTVFENSPGVTSFQNTTGFSGFGLEQSVSTFSTSVLEHSSPGTVVGTVLASDPDFYTVLSYSIIGGNSNGMFAIDHDSGTITVAGDPTAAIQNLYSLTVVVSDQTPPVPLMATSTVSISIELPYQRGSISCAAYTNIPGTTISALTTDPKFPLDPAWEEQIPQLKMVTTEPDPFGLVMRGYLLPPTTGPYTFWIASQGNSELWLSRSTNPADMTRIAYLYDSTNWAGPGDWTNSPTQQSAAIKLPVGYAYYLEARLKAGSSSNYLGIAWECLSNGISQQIVPGQFLAPYHMNYVPHPIGFSANLPQNAIDGSQVGIIKVSDVNSADLETLSLLSADPPGVFSLDPETGAVRLVDESALALTNTYTLIVQATDNGNPPLSGTASVTINVLPANGIYANSVAAEIWTNIPGTALSNLLSQAKFPQQPDEIESLYSLELTSTGFGTFAGWSTNLVPGGAIFQPSNLFIATNGEHIQFPILSTVGTSYGARIRGYLTPTNTGAFTFFVSSADDSVFLLGSTTNPVDATPIAWVTGGATNPRDWTKYVSQQSMPLWLKAGQKCYFETLAKTGSGNLASAGGSALGNLAQFSYGHVEVGWSGPGLPGTNVIDGAFLSPIDIEYAPVFSNRTVILPITTPIGGVITTLAATASAADTLAYNIISGNVSNTFALNPYTGELSIADTTSFRTYAVSNFSLVVEVQNSGYGGLYPLKSTYAIITIPVLDNTPAIVWSGHGNDGNWSTANNWNGFMPTDRSKIIFAALNQQTNHNDYLTGADLITLSSTGFYLDGNPLLLRGGLVNRGNNIWAIPSILVGPQTISSSSGTLVIKGEINDGAMLNLQVDSSMVINGVISGSGGLTKFGNGPLILGAKNSYTGPTEVLQGSVILTNLDSLSSSLSLNLASRAVLDVRASPSLYTIASGQTLTGNGIVAGSLTVEGKLAPSVVSYSSTSPAMVFSNDLVLAGNTTLHISPNQSQPIRVTGQLFLGGTLTVLTNSYQNYTINTIDSSFRIFDAPKIVGTFAHFDLPEGFKWDTSQLTNNGTIRIVAIEPVVMPFSAVRTNGAIILSFQTTPSHQYDVQSTTSLQSPVHWVTSVTRTGTGGILSITFGTPAGTAPQRFFRIRAR